MANKLIAFAILLIAFSGFAFATSVNVYPEADTWVDVSRTPALIHGSDTELISVIMPSVLIQPNFLRFNNTLYKDYLITNARFKYYVNASAICATNGCYQSYMLLRNNTWNESSLNGTNYPAYDWDILAYDMRMGTAGGVTEGSDFFSNTVEGTSPPRTKTWENTTALIQYLYNSSKISFSNFPNVYSGATVKNHTIQSREGANPPYLLLNVTTHFGGLIRNTDLVGFTEFDFETATNITGQYFQAMDFDYTVNTNLITPHSGTGILMASNLLSSNANNDLETSIQDCAFNRGYNSTSKSVNPLGLYSVFCFNLSAQHEGRPFYAMIKVINNTNVRGNASIDFDFYYEVIAPTQNSFSYPVYSPNPPQPALNLTVSWITTQPITTNAYYRYNSTSSNLTWANAWQFIEGAQNFSIGHQVVINNQFTVYGFYEIYFTGNSSTGTFYTSQVYNFNITPFTTGVSNATLPTAIDRLVETGIVPDFAGGIYLVGIILLLLVSVPVYFLAGTKVGVAVFVSMILAEGLMGFLPSWIFIPFIVFAGAYLVKFFGGILGGRNE